MKYTYRITMLSAALCAASVCQAGPPYNVDDPGTALKRTYEINAAYVSTSARGSENEQVPNVEINYGYTDTLQLTIDAGTTSQRLSGQLRRSGIDDTGLEAKWRFVEESPSRPQVALDFRFTVPTASVSEKLGTGHFDYAPEVIAGKSYGRTSLFSNLGLNVFGGPASRQNIYIGFAGSYQINQRLNIGAQIYGNAAQSPDEPDLNYGLAIEDTYQPNRTLMLAIGRSADGQSDLNVYAGLQLVLGPKSTLPRQ